MFVNQGIPCETTKEIVSFEFFVVLFGWEDSLRVWKGWRSVKTFLNFFFFVFLLFFLFFFFCLGMGVSF